jgi:hypothetical protein
MEAEELRISVAANTSAAELRISAAGDASAVAFRILAEERGFHHPGRVNLN